MTSSKAIRRVHLRKEAFKFASAHMTIFEDGTKEALHGHNYTVELTFEFISPTPGKPLAMIPFSILKKPIKLICDAWDEKVLLATDSAFFKLKKKTEKESEFLVCDRRYVLPTDEVVFLSTDNITAEALAEEFCSQYLAQFKKGFLEKFFQSIQVRVDESPGQGASYTWSK